MFQGPSIRSPPIYSARVTPQRSVRRKSSRQLRAIIDTHIHYSFEPAGGATRVRRWLLLAIDMPLLLRPLRRPIISAFDKENLRTIAALATYAEAHRDELPGD